MIRGNRVPSLTIHLPLSFLPPLLPSCRPVSAALTQLTNQREIEVDLSRGLRLRASTLLEQWRRAVNGGPRVRGDRAPARPARRQRRRGCRGGEEAGFRGDHRPQAEAGAAGGAALGEGGGGWHWRRRRPRRGPTVVASSSQHRRRRYGHEEVAEPEQRGHRRRAAGPRKASRPQGTGGGLAARPVVPQEHPGRPIPEKWRRRQGQRRQVVTGVREGEHGRRAVPAQGGPEDVRELPGAVQGAPEDVQLLHHRQLRAAGDDERGDEAAGGPSERLRRLLAHVRGQGRRLDARRRRPLGDVRGVVQAPPDHERIGSRRPRTQGDGQVQQQLLSKAYYCGNASVSSRYQLTATVDNVLLLLLLHSVS